jgi:hypothetical protein
MVFQKLDMRSTHHIFLMNLLHDNNTFEMYLWNQSDVTFRLNAVLHF